MKRTLKRILPLCLAVALTAPAHAQTSQSKPAAQEKAQEKAQAKKPVPDINKSPWSAETTTSSDGYFGTMDTVIKRDMGDGWAIGGKMSTPYQDQKIGGSGPPGLERYESPKGSTLFGPYLEKKF